MKEQLRPDLSWMMEEARRLLELGKLQEALVLAMDVLWRELDQLRGALEAHRGYVQGELLADEILPEDRAQGDGQDHAFDGESARVWIHKVTRN